MIRVVILSAFASPLRSGAEACAEEVAARVQHDVEVTIITARMRKDLPHIDRLSSGVRVWRVGVGSSIDKWLYPFLAPFAARALKPEVIHGVLETFAGLALYCCGWIIPSAQRLLTLQTTNRSFLKGMIVRSPHRVVAISNALKHIASSLGRNDVVVLPNGIDYAAIRTACSNHAKIPGRILYVGRLEKMKGIDVLIAAYARLKMTASSPVHLRIVGDGSQRQNLEALVTKLNLTNDVTFAGRVPPEHIAAEFAQATIFCGLSRSEALGNVFLEAQAAGCAVVATHVGGIPDIVEHEKTGILVPVDDENAAATALQPLLKNASLCQKLGDAGVHHAQSFDWQNIAAKYLDIYRKMTEEK